MQLVDEMGVIERELFCVDFLICIYEFYVFGNVLGIFGDSDLQFVIQLGR